jgi:hypothetical protein
MHKDEMAEELTKAMQPHPVPMFDYESLRIWGVRNSECGSGKIQSIADLTEGEAKYAENELYSFWEDEGYD